MDRAKGIDVSHHQSQIDWQQVAAAGYTFAFIRATYVGLTTGSHQVDRQFVENWSHAQDAGLLTTAYHFFVPQANCDTQIDHFLNTFGTRTGDFRLALDFEKSGGMTKEEVMPCVTRAVQLMEAATGQKPIIYTRASWWHLFVNPSPEWAACPLWVANWDNPVGPLLPRDWTSWNFWQWSNNASVPGITTPVDANRFNGSEADLRQYASRHDVFEA